MAVMFETVTEGRFAV